MFCGKCGQAVSKDDDFCPKCGSRIVKNKEEKEEDSNDDMVILKIKPSFKFEYKILPMFFIYTIVIILYSGAFSIVALKLGIIIAAVSFSILVIFLLIKTNMNKCQYKNSSYLLYATKIVYEDNFFDKQQIEIKYKYAREVVMQQSYWQRLCGIGNIAIYTSAGSGLIIRDVENVQEIYSKVKEIIAK